MSESERVRVGRITAAHGVRGEVKIRCFTEVPEDVGGYGPLQDADGHSFTFSALRPAKGPAVIARIEGVHDRNTAEALVGRDLFIPRDRLPPPEEDEWYYSDLIGLVAVNPDGDRLGHVIAVHDFGAGDLIEIAPPSGKPFMVPFTEQCVPDIKLADGTITVIPLRDADEL
ncbi:ribosome maturation factor RimM [Dichotomicrobium thermohalophilum]|uniref:Ribosome maturation factor RimM n=1 Tax=Dichotomicrobium thermohalophilum TaxID=933063 RepID=A0A397Q748_9HYPH|nr:ribosome maturation factor RimM [Dichotomicrobium thermohalophilum]RIA55347.1 16S rRNA processing protein RimM [Dichotomicrobium thermohalophilum]